MLGHEWVMGWVDQVAVMYLKLKTFREFIGYVIRRIPISITQIKLATCFTRRPTDLLTSFSSQWLLRWLAFFQEVCIALESLFIYSIVISGFHASARRRALTPFNMPAMSPTMTEGGIASWKKKEGETFATGDVLLEIVSCQVMFFIFVDLHSNPYTSGN